MEIEGPPRRADPPLGSHFCKPSRPRRADPLTTLAAVLAFSAGIAILVATLLGSDSPAPDDGGKLQPKNLVFMLSDGLGPSIVTASRQFRNFNAGLWRTRRDQNGAYVGFDEKSKPLALDGLLVGTVQTRSANSHVTDAAAGATAFGCGARTNNGWLAKVPKDEHIVFPFEESDAVPCKSLLEKAKEAGFKTAIVAMSRVTHATPAGMVAHTVNRANENLIARQILDSQPDVIIGGGARHFRPKSGSQSSAREDEWDGFAEARGKGYRVVETEAEYLDLLKEGSGTGADWLPPPGCRKLLMLDADGHRPYQLDRRGSMLPGLAESLQLAIRLLQACDERYAVFAEASRVGSALAENDVKTAITEVLEYDRALKDVVLPLAGRDSLVVGAASHDMGGLSLGSSELAPYPQEKVVGYTWYPEVYRGQRASIHEGIFGDADPEKWEGTDEEKRVLKEKILHHVTLPDKVVFNDDLRRSQFDPAAWSDEDFEAVYAELDKFGRLSCRRLGTPKDDCVNSADRTEMMKQGIYADGTSFKVALGRVIAQKAGNRLGTRGPTPVDVSLYCRAPPPGTCAGLGLGGNLNNCEVGRRVALALGLSPELQRLEEPAASEVSA